MAMHSIFLPGESQEWKPGGLPSMGSHRVRHDWCDLAAAADFCFVCGKPTEDEMAGWHHWLDGRGSEWTLGVGDGQGGLACCHSWGCKESDTTEWLNWTELNYVCMLQTKLELLCTCPVVSLCHPMDCSPAGSSVYGSILARWCWQLTGVNCHFLLQGILLLQGSNLCLLGLLHWQANSLPLSHLGWLFYKFNCYTFY